MQIPWRERGFEVFCVLLKVLGSCRDNHGMELWSLGIS